MSKIQVKLSVKTISLFLALFLLLSFSPILALTVRAVNSEALLKDKIANGNDEEIKLTGNITIGDPGEEKNGLTVSRNITLDLNGKTLEIIVSSKSTNGIEINAGKTLTIKDSIGGGKLIAKNINNSGYVFSRGYGAGINTTDATLTILSGIVMATGVTTGIGGGDTGGYNRSDVNISGGTVNISGGTVTAIGGKYSAGIGGSWEGTGGTVNITGGTVTAIGGAEGPGIGGADYGSGGGIVNISGGTVTATGGICGAGIGGSALFADSGGTVNISGGTVTATGGTEGAGIGGGFGSYGENVTISGGIVTATGGDGDGSYDRGGAGIGGGGTTPGLKPTEPGTLIITGGSVMTKSGARAAPESDATRIATNGTNPVMRVDISITDTVKTNLEGVEISAGSYKAYTNKKGAAAIWIPDANGKEVTFTKTGYSAASKQVSLMTGRGYSIDAVMVASDANGSTTPDAFPFTDVPISEWYHTDVEKAYKSGLINGKSPTLYAPNDNMTVAEAVKLAACIHQLYKDGMVTHKNGTVQWYSTFMTYALSNGIIEVDLSARAGEMITRQEYVYIFYAALPESEYKVINIVVDGAIPDVSLSSTSKFAQRIYTFYRAGILTGSDVLGTFNPASNIKRSEVAAILTRMLDATTRRYLSL